MTITNEYIEKMKTNYTKIVYYMSKDKLFIAIGLELIATNVCMQVNTEFKLKDITFAYYNPIDNTIYINIEDPFFTCASSEDELMAKLFFIVYHEASHKLLMHTQRANYRDHSLWNMAGDYEIHNVLNLNYEITKNSMSNSLYQLVADAFKIVSNNKNNPEPAKGQYNFLYASEFLDKIAEEIYQIIQNSKVEEEVSFSFDNQNSNNDGQNSQNSSDGNINNDSNDNDNDNGNDNNGNSKSSNSKNNGSNKITGKVITYTLPNGKKHQIVDINWPDPSEYQKDKEQQKNNEENAELRKQLWENNIAQESEKNKGNISSSCKKFLNKLLRVKIDWKRILKNSLQTILSKADEFSWSKTRISTFAMDLPRLPGLYESVNGYGTVIISCDESGSMSDDDIRAAAQIIIDAKEHYKNIIVLKHDTEIVAMKEFNEVDDSIIEFLLKRSSCGGTSHEKVFSFLVDYYKKHRFDDENKISCYIAITDGCSDIQSIQDNVPAEIPMIYLSPVNCLEYFNGVKGQIIPIEL